MLARFDRECLALFNPEHVEAGGYRSEDRRGVMAFHALVTLSIGAVLVDPSNFHQYQEVARAASEAKRMAKRIDGSSLFIDQRRMPFGRRLVTGEPPVEADAAPHTTPNGHSAPLASQSNDGKIVCPTLP